MQKAAERMRSFSVYEDPDYFLSPPLPPPPPSPRRCFHVIYCSELFPCILGNLGGGGGGEGGATFCDYALCPIFRRWELAAVLQVGPWLAPSPPPLLYAAF